MVGNSSARIRTGDLGLMNPALYQLSYAAVRGNGIAIRARMARRHCDMTLLIVKIGRSRARATPPMMMPMTMIIAGSM